MTTREDLQKRLYIDRDPEIFGRVIEYLHSDRTSLPSPADHKLREATEAEIKYWGLDAGLASPSSLTSNLATRFQELLNTMPDVQHCEQYAALEKWKRLDPLRLSELALHSGTTVDLDDEKYELQMPSADSEDKVYRVVDKAGSGPSTKLIRHINKLGEITEGFYSED